MASAIPSNTTDDMHSVLLSIQRDPAKAGTVLPSLSQAQLLQLFALFIDDDDVDEASADDKSKQRHALRPSAYVALSSYISSIRKQPTSAQSQISNEEATNTLVKSFAPTIEDTLSGTNIFHLTSTFAFLSALFQVDPQTAAAIFLRDGTIEGVADAMELRNTSASRVVSGIATLRCELATLLSHAVGYKACRKAIINDDATSGEGRIRRCLNATVEGKERRAQVAAALTLVKLHQGSLQDAEADPQNESISSVEHVSSNSEGRLALMMEKMLLAEITPNTSSTTSSTKSDPSKLTLKKSILDAVEGLAYLSVHTSVKAHITSSPSLIDALIKIAVSSSGQNTEGDRKVASFGSTAADREKASSRKPSNGSSSSSSLEFGIPHVNVGLHYGLALLFANLCQYRPHLGKEEEQIAKLRSLTKPSNASKSAAEKLASTVEEDPGMADEEVWKRILVLCKAGMLPVLASLGRSESGSARACVARVYAAVVDDQRSVTGRDGRDSLRGKVLAAGGGKVLLGIIKADRKDGKVPDWIAIQALSKLAITASPLQVFGSDIGSTYDAIPVFSSVLTYSASSSSSTTPLRTSSASGAEEPNDLQRFEAIMALTNIASINEEVANRIVSTKGLWEALEDGMLEEGHEGLMRRASVELLCNLVVTQKGFEMFVPLLETQGLPRIVDTEEIEKSKSRQESRLHLLVALSDVEDLPTRRAASGALAMLTSEERICAGMARLQEERGTMLSILGRLLVDEPDESNDDESARLTIADPQLVHRGIVILRNLAVVFISPKPVKAGARELVECMAKEGIVGLVETIVKEWVQRGEKSGPVLENAVEFVVGLRRFEG